MKRIKLPERPEWRKHFEEMGFTFHSLDGEYWKEGVCYEFTSEQVDYLDDVTLELQKMCVQVVDRVVQEGLYHRLGLPFAAERLIERSWKRGDISLYGRMDFAYDGVNHAKFLEYNADTPTSLYEASVAQWTWLNELHPEYDQFNSIHERLLDRFKQIARRLKHPLYFTCVDESEEDWVTVQYLRDLSTQAGIDSRFLFIDEIGLKDNRFVDLKNKRIRNIFKLYPWEWMLQETFGPQLNEEPFEMVLEPAWKLILTSKGILPLLWEMFPNHPNLLMASDKPLNGMYVKKPLFSREGANISIWKDNVMLDQTLGAFGHEGYIYQEFFGLPKFDEQYTLIGSWIIGNETAGIGIREDDSLITKNTSKFVPHYFKPV